jgi:alpha-mannosidase
MVLKGRYSGSERLDPSTLKEPDNENDFTRKMWLEDLQDDPDFHEEIKEKVDSWKKAISMSVNPDDLKIYMVGESHIDVAWLWRYEQTRQKAIITFRNAVTHAKMFPKKYCYALSEPILLEWIKEDDPELFKDIQKTVKAGGIELVGGSYVEPDCMMPSGEAFIRTRLYGMRFFKKNFNVLPKVAWFLDSFGYNWGLPQILAKSGAEYFWTSKITWNLQTTFPFVNFWWEGPDGTRLLTANFQMGTGPIDRFLWFEMGRRPLKKDGRKVWNYATGYGDIEDHVEEDEICPHVGNFFGRGDGGHGPTSQEVAVANEYESLGFGKWSRVETFYKELAKWSDRFPVWADELYLENHRGTFSVHAEVKRHNRKYENALASMESLGVLTSLINSEYKYPAESLDWLWKTVLKNQFHDVLPGSSIPEVYDDSWNDWVKSDEMIDEMISKVGESLVKVPTEPKKEPAKEPAKEPVMESAEIFLYNPCSWNRASRVFIPITIFKESPKLDENGRPNYAKLKLDNNGNRDYICQPIAKEPEGTIEAMPAGWWAVIHLNALSVNKAQLLIVDDEKSSKLGVSRIIKANSASLTNEKVKIVLDKKTGAILELSVKNINNKRNLLVGNRSNLVFGYEDTPKQWPAWNIKEEYWKYPLNFSSDQKVEIKVAEIGPVFATLEINRILGNSSVTQKISMFKDNLEVYMEFLTDWKQPEVMLKILYELGTHSENVISDIAYSAINRSTLPTTPSDKARYEKICHKYFDLSTPDNSWGIALINEGKYAYDASGNNMRLTLLRSPPYPGPSGESWAHKEREFNRKTHNHEVPKYSGLGPFKCRYALLPHLGGALQTRNGDPNTIVKYKSEELNQPVIVIPAKLGVSMAGILLPGDSLLKINTPNVLVGALKFNEWESTGTIILRLVEGMGLPAKAIISFNSKFSKKIKSVKAVDLLERPIEYNYKWDPESLKLEFSMGKFEISTFEIEI